MAGKSKKTLCSKCTEKIYYENKILKDTLKSLHIENDILKRRIDNHRKFLNIIKCLFEMKDNKLSNRHQYITREYTENYTDMHFQGINENRRLYMILTAKLNYLTDIHKNYVFFDKSFSKEIVCKIENFKDT